MIKTLLITILILAVASKETKDEKGVLEKDGCAVNFYKVPTRQRVIISQTVSLTYHKAQGQGSKQPKISQPFKKMQNITNKNFDHSDI